MRKKHNKKRNTAFLFELLNRIFAKSIIDNDMGKKSTAIQIIRDSFKANTALYEELQIYKSILETRVVPYRIAEKTLHEAKKAHGHLSAEQIFQEQSNLIKRINMSLDKEAYSWFVPNYKNIATVYQIFNSDLNPASRVLLEENMINYMSSKQGTRPNVMKSTDNLTFNVFVSKFNDAYKDSLLKEQKQLLNNYIISFKDGGVELKIFLNEEVRRLRDSIDNSRQNIDNESLKRKLEEVVQIIDKFKSRKIDRKMVEQILGIQNLAREITSHVD